MSYNIMGKNASFKGDVSGTIENQVNDWDNQSISGNKTFTAAITSSADVMLSGSGKISASFFYGDGTGLSGVGGTPGGSDREVQFNNSSAFGASANFKFTAGDELQVAGQISASLGVSGSEFHGDGSNLTAVTASFVTASNVNGILNASQVNIGEGLEANANAIRVNLDGANSGLARGSGGMSLDVHGLSAGSYSDASTIALGVGAGNTTKITLSTLEQNLQVSGSNIVGANSVDNSVLPTNITASGHVSASAFFGDGSALEGVTATPTPAGSNTQIQFNNDGALAGDADLTFLTGSDTLATTIVSASAHVSASEFAIGNGTVIDSDANFSGNNAFFAEITASSVISSSANISGAAFIGDGRELSGVPLGSSNASSVVFINNAGNQTITTNADFKFNGTNVLNEGGGFHGTTISSSANTSIGGNLVIGESVTLSSAELGVLDGVTAGTAAASKAMVLDANADITGFRRLKSATDGNSTIELTASTGRVLISPDPDEFPAITTRNTSNTVTFKVDLDSGNVTSQGQISGSGNILAGGAITGSALHTNGGITAPDGGGGDFTFLDTNGNITAGAITMVDGAGTLNFGDNSISGSGNISGSAFFGDGSNLQNVSATPQFRYHTLTTRTRISNNFNTAQTFNLVDLNDSTGNDLVDQSTNPITWFQAPGSGSVARVIYTPIQANSTSTSNTILTSHSPQFYYRKNSIVEGVPVQGNEAHVTASSANMKSLSVTNAAGTFTTQVAIFDMENNNPTVSGSNSFGPGDILVFSGRNDATVIPLMVTIVLKIEQEGVSYP